MSKRKPSLDETLLEDLQAFVRLCFLALNEEDLKEVANKTQLSLSTVRRLLFEECTINVRWGTIAKLGNAAGLRLHVSSDRKRATIEQTQVLPDSFYLSSKK